MPEWIKDHKEVTGKFRNFECPGAPLRFYYRKWPTDTIEEFNLDDDQTYTLPYMVAKHLNEDCWVPVHEHAKDAKGNNVERVGRKEHNYGFYSYNFEDDLQPAPTIYTVEEA